MRSRISSTMDTHKKKAWLALFCVVLVASVCISVVFATRTTNSTAQTTFAYLITRQAYPSEKEAEEIARRAKEIELASGIVNFDGVDDVSIILSSNSEVLSANIILMTTEEIGYSEIDSIVLFVSKSVENLDKANIQIKDQNDNTIYPN